MGQLAPKGGRRAISRQAQRPPARPILPRRIALLPAPADNRASPGKGRRGLGRPPEPPRGRSQAGDLPSPLAPPRSKGGAESRAG